MQGREHFWAIDDVGLFYVLAAAATLVFVAGVARRARPWLAVLRGDGGPIRIAARILAGGAGGLGWLRGDRRAGAMHAAIAWGFSLLFVGTVLATIDHYVLPVLRGRTYLVYSAVLDAAGVALLLGLIGAAARRYLLRVRRLESRLQDAAVLAGLALAAATGFAVEGLRLVAAPPPGVDWSFAGALLAAVLPRDPAAARAAYPAAWWLHSVVCLGIVAALPWTRLFHVFAAPAHLALARAPAPYVPLDDRPEQAPPLSPRDLLALDACTRCGRCVEVCPATAAGEPFSPRGVLDAARSADVADDPRGLLGHATLAWRCTTCAACLAACPIDIAPADLVRAARRVDIEDGTRVPTSLAEVLDRLQRHGNPWESSRSGRARFHAELGLADLSRGAPPTPLAWVVGCTTAIDTRARGLARAFSKLTDAAGLDVGTLGRKEGCCGDIARQLGEDGLFEEQAEALGARLDAAGAEDVVASSPHCLASLRREGRRVRHTSEVLDALLQEGRLSLPTPVRATVTFHDPCTLGRQGGVYDAPRRVLAAIEGVDLVEMARSRERSFCCGAGGGRMWQEDLDGEVRMSSLRVREAAATRASILVTACPLCAVMLDDARKAEGLQDRLEVVDLCELAARALGEDPAERTEP